MKRIGKVGVQTPLIPCGQNFNRAMLDTKAAMMLPLQLSRCCVFRRFAAKFFAETPIAFSVQESRKAYLAFPKKLMCYRTDRLGERSPGPQQLLKAIPTLLLPTIGTTFQVTMFLKTIGANRQLGRIDFVRRPAIVLVFFNPFFFL